MNTGIQDAANLGWKLAFSATSSSPEQLLDSYDLKRRPVAGHVLALTHAVFWAESATDPLAAFLRSGLAPLAAPFLPLVLGRKRLIAEMVRPLARFREDYRTSPLSVDAAPPAFGGLRAGDRFPDRSVTTTGGQRTRLHALLARPGVHVLFSGERSVQAVSIPDQPLLHMHRLTDMECVHVLAVRPDGHLGYRGAPEGLPAWLARVGAPGRR